MTEVSIVLAACILLAFLSEHGKCCGPAEIGQQYTIISSANVPVNSNVSWGLQVLKVKATTILYDSKNNASTQNVYHNLYLGAKNNLTILNVSKDDGSSRFQHTVNMVVKYTCTLPVYKRASTPACEPVTLIDNQIRTKCTTAQVYPKAFCQFILHNGDTNRTVTGGTTYIGYTHTDPQSGGNEYNSTSCTLQYPVDGLKPGNWTVRVNMYPGLTGVSLAQGTIGQANNSLDISLPSNPPIISARSNEHGDNLVVGDDVTVTCDVKGGYPSVQSVNLTCDHNEHSVSTDGTSAKLTLNKIGVEYNKTNCTCQATHVTGYYDLMSVYSLTLSTKNKTQSGQQDSPPIGAAVGGAFGAFALIAIVAVGVIFFIRRRSKKKEKHNAASGGHDHSQDPIEPYDPYKDPEAVRIRNDVYVGAKDYKQIQPTITSATAFPKIYRPDNKDNPYEDVNPEELKRESLVIDTMGKLDPGAKPVPAPKPNPAAEPNVPKTSVKTKSAAEPSVQAEVNEVYATVNKARLQHSKKPSSDQSDDRTKILAAGESPELPKRLYNTEDLRDSVNEPPTSKDVDHTYSNEAFDHEGDENTYANIGKT